MSDDALIRLANLKSLGWGPTDLANKVGNSYQYWRDLLAGNKSFGEKAARNIEEKLSLPRGCLDLAHGCGVQNVDSEARKSIKIVSIRNKQNKPDELVIPQFDTGGAMGSGLLLRDQPGVIQSWVVNAEWVQKNIKSHTGAANLCIVTGFGDSMKGMFNSGDPLVLDKGVTSVEFDAVYFFRVENEGFIKRLQRIPGEGLRVLSENKKYDSWTVKPGMDFEVFGRVVKAWQGEDF
ncbi:MAG: S24 family peptidase [Rhodoferax sp.]|nr:S24 family peptidase [Rhodoferax sp.]MDP3651066.1 S24 family peptidase [Rhodoferax sp.]